MSTRRGRAVLVVGVILIVAVVILCALGLQTHRDYAFICENTGSHKGYRQWGFGWQAREWYRESHLEQFMRLQHPTELRHRWTSYSGTGKNILGQPIRFGHGRPQVGSVIMDWTWFDSYVDTLDGAAKLDLYRVLVSGNRDAIATEEKKIEEAILISAARNRTGPRRKKLASQ